MNSTSDATWRAAIADIRRTWKPLLVTDLVYRAITLVILTPIVGLLFRTFLALTGRTVLADEDILQFLLSPMGWLTAIVVGAVAIGVLLAEQCAYITILASSWHGAPMTTRQVLWYTSRKASDIVMVSGRLIARTLAIAVPFVVIGLVVYELLLSKYDINYYLSVKPPAFLAALAIGAILLATLAWILIPMLLARVYALPLVILEDQPGRNALSVSCQRTQGRLRRLAKYLGVWAAANFLLATALAAVVALAGRPLLVASRGSITMVIIVSAVVTIAWTLVNYVTSLLAHMSFAALFLRLYREDAADLRTLSLPRAKTALSLLDRMMRAKRLTLCLGCLVLVLAALLAAVGLLESITLEDEVDVIAHRGASHDAPENTMAAVRLAIEQGADWVEIDVQDSVDGIVVVAHDSDLKKVGGPGTKIWEATAAELQSVDIGSWFDPKFREERIPTLEDVLRECKGKAKVTIELKYYGHADKLEQRIVDVVESLEMESDVVTMSLKQDLVRSMRKLRPTWDSGLLTATAIGSLRGVEADFLAVSAGMATRSLIDSAHRDGKQVFVWTINDAISMGDMMNRGVDGVITDKPALARAVLQRRAEMTVVEHLLFEIACMLGATPEFEVTIDDA